MKAIYGLLGYPLGHSFSKMYFNEKFQSENISAEYRNFEIEDISLIRQVVVTEPNLCGLNVTIPYKESVIKYLDDLDEKAERIGAVNVIKFIRQKIDYVWWDIILMLSDLKTLSSLCFLRDVLMP